MAREAVRAFLLDLDNTLLINDMEAFTPPYYRALMNRMRGVCTQGVFAEALNAGVRAMLQNDGRATSNAQIFRREFYSISRCDPADVEPVFESFYRTEFETLSYLTAPDPAARDLVRLLFDRGFKVAIATQPLFPRDAIEARLRWAGVGTGEFAYDFISSFENLSACKPQRAYFDAILRQLGCRAAEAIMVGDSVEADLPAGRMGMRTFWVTRGHVPGAGAVACSARGSLRDLVTMVETGAIHELG